MPVRGIAVLLTVLALAGCGERRKPPAALWFDDLPVQGSRDDARKAGFDRCVGLDARTLRCRREGVTLLGEGPYHAAVDMRYSDGSGGFDRLTLWADGDQIQVHAVGKRLEAQGWSICRTGSMNRGDQEIYTMKGAPIAVSIDISYWGKRRLRVFRAGEQPGGKCW